MGMEQRPVSSPTAATTTPMLVTSVSRTRLTVNCQD
jgi:hypothetical protein